jgi:glycerol-3-phosphate dehydrogenase (NAD(P)+)
MAKIAIIGSGLMGSAMSWPLSSNGHEIRLVGTHLDREIITSCKEKNFHPALKRKLPPRVIPYYLEELPQALDGVEVMLQGVNSLGVEWFARTIGPHLRPEAPLIAITKGLAAAPDGSLQILPAYLNSMLPPEKRDRIPLAAVGGPCIAGELAGHRQTCVYFTGIDQAVIEKLAALFRTDYYHIWLSTDIIGVEACVALKNGYVLGISLAQGLLQKAGGLDEAGANMFNLASAVFAQAGYEMEGLVQLMGGDKRLVTNLPGIGDMYVTSMGGRTAILAKHMGNGLTLSQARALMPGVTLEALEVIRVVGDYISRAIGNNKLSSSEFPIMRYLYRLVTEDSTEPIPLDDFFGGRK